MAINKAMMATTTSTSTSVKARRRMTHQPFSLTDAVGAYKQIPSCSG
jgi:hypothetical protein